MSQKLIELLVHFSYFYDNLIACFYSEICTNYQIYILQKFIGETKIPVRIRRENSSMAKVRSQQGIKVRQGICDAPKPGGQLTTRQPAEYSRMSGDPTYLMKIGQNLLYMESSTQIHHMSQSTSTRYLYE